MTIAYIGLGSNLDDPVKQIKAALAMLQVLPLSHSLHHSCLYWSESLLPGQARYCNAVAEIKTGLTPEQLLDSLQMIEFQQGRVRAEKWGPRVIDLDILLYAQQIICTERLVIPHPELVHRDFWLYPLAELKADLMIPGSHLPLARMVADELPIGLEIIL